MVYRRLLSKLRKQRQREKQREWLIKHHGVATAEALVTKMMKSHDLTNKAKRI